MSNQYSNNLTPITKEQFDYIINQISTTKLSISNICKDMSISKQSFYDYKRIVGTEAEDQYARSKKAQIDVIQDEISELQDKCLDEIRTIEDPKRCNALQSAYREQIRHLEWLSERLRSDKYGNRVDITSNGLSVTREISISLPGKLPDGSKVSINPMSSIIPDNANASTI